MIQKIPISLHAQGGRPMIFISYSSIDTEWAQTLRARLERDGLSCWMAPEDIRAGQDYASEIPAAIANCSVFLLLLTDNAQRSTWIPKELDTAINLSKPIIPFVADGLVMIPAFVFKLVNVQAVMATGNDEKDYDSLAKALRQRLPIPTEKPFPAPEAPQAAKQEAKLSPSRKKNSRKALWSGLLILLLCAALVCAGIIAATMARHSTAPESSDPNSSELVIMSPSISVREGSYLLLVHADDTCTIVEYTDKTVESLTVPSRILGYKVTGIGETAFSNCNRLVSIKLPDEVTEIGELAFRWCDQLASIQFPDALTKIGVAAFSGCHSLTSVEFPSGLQYIDNQAFLTTGLKEVRLPNHLTHYGAYAFSTSTTVIVMKNTTTEDTIHRLAYDMGLPQEFVFAQECSRCRGRGLCISCRGSGEKQYNLYKPAELCLLCAGTGNCSRCVGKGYTVP